MGGLPTCPSAAPPGRGPAAPPPSVPGQGAPLGLGLLSASCLGQPGGLPSPASPSSSRTVGGPERLPGRSPGVCGVSARGCTFRKSEAGRVALLSPRQEVGPVGVGPGPVRGRQARTSLRGRGPDGVPRSEAASPAPPGKPQASSSPSRPPGGALVGAPRTPKMEAQNTPPSLPSGAHAGTRPGHSHGHRQRTGEAQACPRSGPRPVRTRRRTRMRTVAGSPGTAHPWACRVPAPVLGARTYQGPWPLTPQGPHTV